MRKQLLAALLLFASPAAAQITNQYLLTPLTPGQHGLAIVASTGLTIPSSTQYAVVCAQTALAHYTTDGTTTPTATVGNLIPVNTCITLSGGQVVTNFRAISATGTLDVEYFR